MYIEDIFVGHLKKTISFEFEWGRTRSFTWQYWDFIKVIVRFIRQKKIFLSEFPIAVSLDSRRTKQKLRHKIKHIDFIWKAYFPI